MLAARPHCAHKHLLIRTLSAMASTWSPQANSLSALALALDAGTICPYEHNTCLLMLTMQTRLTCWQRFAPKIEHLKQTTTMVLPLTTNTSHGIDTVAKWHTSSLWTR